MKLDVGCGDRPTGDVNCDLHVRDIGHRTGRKGILGETIDSRRTKDFVVCDVQFLPFRAGVFEQVYSWHVIEHVENPFLMLKEMIRVSNHTVLIICPHRLGDCLCKPRNPFHVGYFNKSWFFHAAKALGCFVRVDYSLYDGFPFHYFGLLRVPTELRVEIKLKTTVG